MLPLSRDRNRNLLIQEYFASLYESVHGSLERTLAGRGSDQSEDENGSDQSETGKKTNSQNNQTPTEISDYDE